MTTNFNEATQLPYGVIAGASLHPDVQAQLWEMAYDVEHAHQEQALREVCEKHGYDEEKTEAVLDAWNYNGDGETDDFDFQEGPNEDPCARITYEGITLHISHLGGAMIVTSIDGPVCSVASMCSPCVPGAADLDSGRGSIRCHGVPFEWLSEDEPESLGAPKQEPEQQAYLCLPTAQHLKQYPVSKGGLAKELYPNVTYDFALPQSWVDSMYQRGFDNVASQFVWGYPDPKDSHGQPLPLTTDAVSMLSQLARWI